MYIGMVGVFGDDCIYLNGYLIICTVSIVDDAIRSHSANVSTLGSLSRQNTIKEHSKAMLHSGEHINYLFLSTGAFQGRSFL